ncbi:hypothetical protein BH11ACT2_BH11ACT2_11100 [soil metagenome]
MFGPVVGVVMVIAAIGGFACALASPATRRPLTLAPALVLTLAMIDEARGAQALISPLIWAAILIVLAPVSLVAAGRGERSAPMSVHRALLPLLVADLLVVAGFGAGSPTSTMQHSAMASFSPLAVLAVAGVIACVAFCVHHWATLVRHRAHPAGANGMRHAQSVEISLMTICVVSMAAMAS